MRTRSVLLSLMLATAAAPSTAQNAPTVAVLDFEAFSVTLEDASAVGRGLASMIMTELQERPQVRVVDRQEIETMLRQRRETLHGRGDDAALRLGQLVGAQFVVVGNVALEPKQARLDIRILNVETGAVEHATKRTGPREEFLAVVEQLADEFTSNLRLPERSAEVAVSIPVAASLAYSRALDYEKRGKTEEAAQMFRRALEAFPAHEGARAGLNRIGRGDS